VAKIIFKTLGIHQSSLVSREIKFCEIPSCFVNHENAQFQCLKTLKIQGKKLLLQQENTWTS